ncbi:hypothetical protein P692DRAFT_201803058 [Suillus brevipes Sb2]|nr:hypothetical protein P692DRAFT_201803058 [Suillus brevipes Sb2]
MHTLQSSDTIIEKIQGYATDSLFLKGALQISNTYKHEQPSARCQSPRHAVQGPVFLRVWFINSWGWGESVLRTIHSYSNVVRASSHWLGPSTPKEITTELDSVVDDPVLHTKSVEDVNELLNSTLPPAPGEAGPDSESAESDDDGRPSKCKSTDPREWGATGLEEGELDINAQRAAFAAWNAAKEASVVSEAEPGDTSPDEATPESIGISKEEIERLIQERAIKAKIRELNRKLEKTPASEKVPTKEYKATAARLKPAKNLVEKVVKPSSKHVKAESAERAASTKAGKPTVSSITDDLCHLTLLMNPSQPPSFASSMNNDLERPGPCNPPAVSVSALSNNLQQLKLSDGTLDDVGRELSLLHTAMENVSGGVGVVIERKKAIATQIYDLTAQFGSHQDTLHGPIEINTDALQQASVDRSDEISQIVLFLCVACRVVMGSDGSLSSSHENILKQIPLTSDGAEAKFHLTGKTIAYAVCSCHCTYPPTYAPGSMTARYPERCVHCPTPGTECGDTLLVGPEGARRPKKTFMYHDFKDYLSGLLSRRDVEAVMDEACDDLMDSINSPLPPFVKNPFEAQFLCSFGGPKPEMLFINRGEEGRYAFALHVDFFNPEGMNVRGATHLYGTFRVTTAPLCALSRFTFAFAFPSRLSSARPIQSLYDPLRPSRYFRLFTAPYSTLVPPRGSAYVALSPFVALTRVSRLQGVSHPRFAQIPLLTRSAHPLAFTRGKDSVKILLGRLLLAFKDYCRRLILCSATTTSKKIRIIDI